MVVQGGGEGGGGREFKRLSSTTREKLRWTVLDDVEVGRHATKLNLDTHRRGRNPLMRKINCRMRSCSLRGRRGRKVDGFEVELNVHPLLFPSSSFFPRQFSQDRGSTLSDCFSPIPLVSSSSSLFAQETDRWEEDREEKKRGQLGRWDGFLPLQVSSDQDRAC